VSFSWNRLTVYDEQASQHVGSLSVDLQEYVLKRPLCVSLAESFPRPTWQGKSAAAFLAIL